MMEKCFFFVVALKATTSTTTTTTIHESEILIHGFVDDGVVFGLDSGLGSLSFASWST